MRHLLRGDVDDESEPRTVADETASRAVARAAGGEAMDDDALDALCEATLATIGSALPRSPTSG